MCCRANELKVDNSSLTGESDAQDRGTECGAGAGNAFEAENLAFFTTIVVTGTLRGIVVGTADNTAMGQVPPPSILVNFPHELVALSGTPFLTDTC